MSLSRSDTQVMLHADASRSPARAVVSIQRCDSLFAVARERRCLTAPLSRFQILASARPSTAPLPASSARAACNSTPPSAPPLPTGQNPLARARRPPKTNSLVSWTTTISRPATRAAVPLTAWQTISSVVTEPLCRKRRNRISCARLPPSRRIQEPGRTPQAACRAAPLFPGGGRQTAPAQIRPSPIPPRIDHRPTESSLQTGGNKMCAFDSRKRGEVKRHLLRGCARGRLGPPRREADHDQHDEVHHERDDADVEVLDLRRQPGQLVKTRTAQADGGNRGDAGDDACRRALAGCDVALCEAKYER